MAISFLGQSNLKRGLRNNNPGNIRRSNNKWQGKIPFAQSTDKDFEQFESIDWGIRAMYRLLQTYSGQGLNTVQKIISKYAPSNENNTAAYVNAVAKQLSVAPVTVLAMNKVTLIAMAKAMVLIEIGSTDAEKIPSHAYDDAYIYLNHTYGSDTMPEVEVGGFSKKCQHCGKIIAGIALFFFTYYGITI